MDKMNLKNTVSLMVSRNYKKRFKAEYWQTKIRYLKLKNLNNEIEAAIETGNTVTDHEHGCPTHVLRQQQKAMGAYLHVLEVRAKIEGICLDEIDPDMSTYTVSKPVKYAVGDQIEVNLTGFGKFTATAQKIYKNNVCFMFDRIITYHTMNNESVKNSSYEASDLCDFVGNVIKAAFPKDIRSSLINVTIPSYGQIFGHDNYYKTRLVPDDDKQFELMKDAKNKIGIYNNKIVWYWLRNALKPEHSSTAFAVVSGNGAAYAFNASTASVGVRPCFTIRIQNPGTLRHFKKLRKEEKK